MKTEIKNQCVEQLAELYRTLARDCSILARQIEAENWPSSERGADSIEQDSIEARRQLANFVEKVSA